jgi:antitoxin YefM
MTSITVTEARKSLYRLLDEVQESHEAIHITGKRNGGVLISAEDWRALMETVYLNSVPGMADSIAKGMKTPVDTCLDTPGW